MQSFLRAAEGATMAEVVAQWVAQLTNSTCNGIGATGDELRSTALLFHLWLPGDVGHPACR